MDCSGAETRNVSVGIERDVFEGIKNSDIENINEAVKTWKDVSLTERTNILDGIWQKSNISHFSYYSDFITLSTDYNKWKSVGLVLVKLQPNFPHFAFYSVVSAALAAGCPIIVELSDSSESTYKCLSHFFDLPKGVFTIFKEPNNDYRSQGISEIFKTVVIGNTFCGEIPELQRNQSHYLNWFVPGHTSAILLEQCDISSALDKILLETWHSGPFNAWTVSTIVVQECVYDRFLRELKFRLKNTSFDVKITQAEKKLLLENTRNVKRKAEEVCAEVLTRGDIDESEWKPIVVLECQYEETGPQSAIKVLSCRTPAEGVTLLNNLKYSLGISVWTQISSQALEVASMLNCYNIWVNCHGITSADIPLTPSGKSGNLISGGRDGIFQFMKMAADNQSPQCITGNESWSCSSDITEIMTPLIQSAKEGFKLWCKLKEKKSYMQKILTFCYKQEILNSRDIKYFCHCTNIFNFSENKFVDNYFTIQKKVPIGVIAIILAPPYEYTSALILICAALALGNSVIILLLQPNKILELITNEIKKILPCFFTCNLFHLAEEAACFLAQDENIEGFWMQHEEPEYAQLFSKLKNLRLTTGKNYWFPPKSISASAVEVFWHQCLKTKVVWLPKTDKLV